jgi:hypothetical protein
VVLHDYAGHIARTAGGTREPLPPVVLHIPHAFFARESGRPAEVWGINLPIRYPEMQPFPLRRQACLGWCDGYMRLSLRNTSNPFIAARFHRLHADIARHAAVNDPAVVFTRREAPLGYTEAYDQRLTKWRPPETRQLYARTNEAGEPVEFAECRPDVPSPACTFLIALDELPQVEVEYSLSMVFWNQRDEVREAVQRLVRTFLAPDAAG